MHGAVQRALALMLALVCLAACGRASNGDFGRVRPSLVSDNTHAWMGQAAAENPVQPPWRHQLTDEERRLRDLAYPLVEPPYNRQQWYSALHENGLWSRPWPYPDRAAYASRLFQTAYRSQTARYNRLIEDIRSDMIRIDPFHSTARYVADMDRRRRQSLDHVSNLTGEEATNTMNRIRENEAVVRWTRESLEERVASYHLALERMVIAAPSQMAVEAERTLALLQQRIVSIRI